MTMRDVLWGTLFGLYIVLLSSALAAVLIFALGLCKPAHAQQGYQIQQRINDEWQVFRTPLGNYAPVQSDTVCALDLASAANAMPKGTILACRRASRLPTPINRNAQGN